jgi:hypothetical protein
MRGTALCAAQKPVFRPVGAFLSAFRVKLQKSISMDFCAFLFTPAENDGMINWM